MHYLIDGYNLLFYSKSLSSPLQDERKRFIRELSHIKATIVFDSSEEHAQAFPVRYEVDQLEIVYAPTKQTADQMIIEWLKWSIDPDQIIVVTNDRHLLREVASLGSKTLSIQEFIKRITPSPQQPSKPPKNPSY